MKTTALLTAFGFFLAAFVAAAPATETHGTRIDAAEKARLAGLQIHWFSQIQLDSARDRVVDIDFHVHDDAATTFYEIRYGDQRETVAFTDVNARGDQYGTEGAKEWVDIRKEILEAEGYTVEVDLFTVPKATLYAITTSGMVQAIDAETGRTRWISRIGLASYPTTGIAVNNKYVIAVKGSKVYCLDSTTGREIWSQPTMSSPVGGMAMSEKYGYVTTLGGFMKAYPLNETGIPAEHFVATGRAVYDPLVTATTVSWPSEDGHYNVAYSDRVESIAYRLKTGAPIRSSGAVAGTTLIINSYDGKVFGIEEAEGKILWEYATGEPLMQPPVNIGTDMVLVITIRNGLIALNPQTGRVMDGWPGQVTGISSFVGASKELLYFLDDRQNLVGLRRDSGNRVVRAEIGASVRMTANNQTDRLYLGDETGALLCLREITSQNPYLHGDDISASIEVPTNPFDTDATEKSEAADPDAKEDASVDPFGEKIEEKKSEKKGDDPFGGGR